MIKTIFQGKEVKAMTILKLGNWMENKNKQNQNQCHHQLFTQLNYTAVVKIIRATKIHCFHFSLQLLIESFIKIIDYSQVPNK